MGRLLHRLILRAPEGRDHGRCSDEDRAGRRDYSGATWAADDTITFATMNTDTGLQRVSAQSGTIDVLTRPDREHGEADHLWPEILPGGHAVLFTITSQTGGLETAQVAVRDLRTGTQKVLCTVAATHTTSPAGT